VLCSRLPLYQPGACEYWEARPAGPDKLRWFPLSVAAEHLDRAYRYRLARFLIAVPVRRLSEVVPVYAVPDQGVCGVDM